jgi:hypothetical protein
MHRTNVPNQFVWALVELVDRLFGLIIPIIDLELMFAWLPILYRELVAELRLRADDQPQLVDHFIDLATADVLGCWLPANAEYACNDVWCGMREDIDRFYGTFCLIVERAPV